MAAVVRALGRRALVVPTDITDEAQRSALVVSALAEFGRVDCLVNNAFAIPPMDPLTTLDLGGLRVAQETNVFAPLRLGALFADAPGLDRSWGVRRSRARLERRRRGSGVGGARTLTQRRTRSEA